MEQELKKALKKKEGPAKGSVRGTYSKKNFMCTKCGKTYIDKKGVIVHMSVKHNEQNYVLTDENYIQMPENGVDDPTNNDGTPKKKGRKKEKLNTRCFPCGKAFSMRPGYKAHIKKFHDNVEPPENSDPANLALPDDRISCLICFKRFKQKQNLRSHISNIHLGIASKNDKGSGSEDEDEKEDKEDAVSLDQDPLADPLGDVTMESTETDLDPVPTEENPNPFTCAVTHCSSAFPAKAFLLLHIKTQHPGVDTSEITLNTKLKLLQNGNSATNSIKSDTDSLPQNQVTEEEMVLIEKMFNSMRKYGCSQCEQRFTNIAKMKKHEKQHDWKPCPYCGKLYSRRDKLVTHCKATHPDKPIPAPAVRRSPDKAAKKKSKKAKILPENEKAESNDVDPDLVEENLKFEKCSGSDRIKCPKCNLTFAFQKGAQRHVKQMHGPGREFKCKECPLSYHDYKGLYQHTSRIHKRKSQDDQDGQSNSDSVESDGGSFVVDENGLDVEPADKKFKCQGCPKAFNNSGQLYLHKKTQHPQMIRQYANSPLADGTSETESAAPPPATKKFPCKACPKIYSSYMSLYMHRKTKHSQVAGQTPVKNGSPGSTNGGVTVINLGTPNSSQEKKPHSCSSCPKRFTDLKSLSKHLEEVHNGPVVVQPTFAPSPDKERERVQCPYCPKIYSRRDKLNQHIRTLHPDQEIPRSPVKVPKVHKPMIGISPKSIGITPMTNGDDDDEIICLDDDVGVNDKSLSGRGKYKEKAFRCTECNKGYCDKKRLETHIENRHTTKPDDPFADVGPNTDIAVSSNKSEIGYEVYKVIGVYTTGVRFKCAKYSPISHDRWTLTEEINKNVMKVNIMKVLKTLKKDQVEKNVYTMDMDELVSLMQTASVDNGEREVNEDEDNDELEDVDDSKEITGVDENGLQSEIDIVDEDVIMPVQ